MALSISWWDRELAPDEVNLLGYSMGAATALLAAQQEPLVRAVAADSAYVDLASVVEFHLRTTSSGSEHLRAYESEPDVYASRLAEFFSRA